jgi:hypothetical protein
MKPNDLLRLMLGLFVTIASCLVLSACQSEALWVGSPELGSSVNEAIQAQLVNPNAPVGNPKVSTGLDGSAAKSAVDNYQKSFEVKVPTSTGIYPAGASYGTSSGAPK